MRWRKLGLVGHAICDNGWRFSHAMVPTPIDRPNLGVIRTYVTFLDAGGIGRPGYMDLDRTTLQVLEVSSSPLIDIGQPGAFDESGVIPTCVVPLDDRHTLMYYVGYELGARFRYRMLTGLAISEDGGESFRRYSQTPILERSDKELLFRCGTFVLREADRFRMWYIAGSEWAHVNGKDLPEYTIKYLESANGLAWEPEGALTLDITSPDEHGFGRPWVVRTLSGYRMFYSVRRKSFAAYRLGYADSADGRLWERRDENLGLDAGPDSFDDRAIMYAATIELNGLTYCFYNGNDYGRDGFAVAVREDA